MSNEIKIGLIQTAVQRLNAENALARLNKIIDRYGLDQADIIILPELWNSGPLEPGQPPSNRETGKLLQGLLDTARKRDLSIISPMAEPSGPSGSDSRPFNSSYVITPQGLAGIYRKMNLFAPMKEDQLFAPGLWTHPFDIPAGRKIITIAPFICYDLRFPEPARKSVSEGACLLIYSALWPIQRIAHFHSLLKARAIENQCFVAGANGSGRFGEIQFGGGTTLFSPQGEQIATINQGEAAVLTSVDMEEAAKTRAFFSTARPPAKWPPLPESKILDLKTLKKICSRRRQSGQKMVFTNGCFDILHAGHVDYLYQARRHGDFLVVGLNSDASVRSIKGPSRPINPQDRRAVILAALECVDYVVFFDDPDPAFLIEDLIPDVLVKGADWKEEEIVGRDKVLAHGGQIIRIPFRYNISTTKIIAQAKNKSNF